MFTGDCLLSLSMNVSLVSGLGLGRQLLRPAWHWQHTLHRRSCPRGHVVTRNNREDLCRTVPQPGTHRQSTVSYLNVSTMEESQYELG